MDSLISAEWLADHLHDPDLVVLDCSVLIDVDADGNFQTRSGRTQYEKGHIPTAGFADLTAELSDKDSRLQYAVPAPEVFAATMAKLGVDDGSRVVLYDSLGSTWAARVWWMLRWIGFDRAALLDGGLDAWTAAGYELSTDIPNRNAGVLTPRVRPGLIVDKSAVHAAIGDDSATLIDALPESSFRGERQMYARPGHIKGAINIPVFSMRTEDGRYKSAEELKEIFSGVDDGRNITYCGGGIAASSTAFVMTRLGYSDVAVYTASLQEWAADPANPMEVSPAPQENTQ
ncbi:MAG: sulfurtransferase [Gammaproteobacteria bacterium]|nr:sulfurtransferase [Gammaproteobacteria bacterium]